MKTQIRHATSKDFPVLLRMDQACFAPDIAYDFDELRYLMKRRGAETLVVEDEAEIVAFLLMDADVRRKHATLITLDVLSAHRRKGYASKLLSHSEEILRGYGIETYELQVDVENSAAIAFYYKHGFKEQKLLRNYYSGNRDAWQMNKKLA